MPSFLFPLQVKFSFALGLLLACCNVLAADSRQELTDRLDRLERVVESQGVAELLVRLEEMQRELQRLQGDIEVQGHEIEELQKSQANAAQELNRRLSATEKSLAGPQALPPQPSMPTLDGAAQTASSVAADQGTDPVFDPETALPSDSETDSAMSESPTATADPLASEPAEAVVPDTEQTAYQHAFELLKQGRYEQAGTAFSAFLSDYPAAVEADNAQYWLGESHYVRRRFDQATQAFQTLLDRYPASPKRADAALKIGFIHYELKEWAAARGALNEVSAQYPGSTAATLAASRLRKMTQEGH